MLALFHALARSSETCGQFSGEEVARVILETTEGEGVVFREGTPVYKDLFVTIPAGLILKVAEIYNSSSGFADDYIRLQDPTTGMMYSDFATSEGSGSIFITGETYGFNYFGAATSNSEDRYITLDYPQSPGQHHILDLSVCF